MPVDDGEIEEAAVGQKLRGTVPELTRVFRSAIALSQNLAGQSFVALAILLVLFIVHQIFIWIDRDPETAFDRGALLFEVAEVSWDTTFLLWNTAIDVFNAGIIPMWNSASFYVVEPVIVLVLEIFSLVFTRKHWTGLFSEEDFPYVGLDCTASAQAAQWCGRYSYYAASLESAEKAPFFVDNSQAYARRRLFDAYNENYTLGIETMRRLSERMVEQPMVSGAFDTDALTDALDDFSVLSITLGSTIADVVFGVVTEALRTSFSVIADALMIVLKKTMNVLKMLIKSGMISTVVSVGVDFIVIFFTEIAMPMLFAILDFVTCMMDLFHPAGWGDQLQCGVLIHIFKPIKHAHTVVFRTTLTSSLPRSSQDVPQV